MCVVNKEKPNQIVNSYLELWEDIINQGIHIELSRSSMYILRRCITSFSFEQGIRMRKIIEKISLQRLEKYIKNHPIERSVHMELKSTETGYVNKKNQKTLVRHQSQGQIITSGFIR